MRKFGWKVMCVLGCSMLLCAGCSNEKEEVWTSAEYAEQDWEEVIPMLGLLQANQAMVSEQDMDVPSKQQFIVEESGKEDAEQSEELMLFASEPTQYEGERSETVRKQQEQRIQEANEKTKYIKENVINPLLERYEKQIKSHFVGNEKEKEYIEIYWSYDYMQDMTNKKGETYTIYLTAVNIWREPNGNITALPWRHIWLTVEMVEDEEKDGFVIQKEEARWDYNIVLEFREDGSMVIRRTD